MEKASCLICEQTLTGPTRHSVCDDPQFAENMWGGDSHRIIGYLCDECGERMQGKAGGVSLKLYLVCRDVDPNQCDVYDGHLVAETDAAAATARIRELARWYEGAAAWDQASIDLIGPCEVADQRPGILLSSFKA